MDGPAKSHKDWVGGGRPVAGGVLRDQSGYLYALAGTLVREVHPLTKEH